MEPKDELDVSAMFQKMGSKLGWFQYKDLDSALHTLSNSTKKKSNKSRRRQESSEDGEALSKSSHNEKKNMKTRKRKEIGKTKLSFSSESPFKDIKGNSMEDNVPLSDSRDDFQIPLRRTPGATDLTRKSQKSKNDKENKNQNPMFEKDEKMKQSSEISKILQNSVETNTNDQSYHKNCHSSPESDFLDLGVPVQESTRIHSRASIDTMLDIPDVSLGLFQQENLSDQIYSYKNHSYKDLNIIKSGRKRVSIGHFQQIIYREQTENNTNLCSKLQNLDLSNNSEEEQASTSNQTDLYTTATSKKFIEVQNTKGLNSIEKSRKSVYFDARTGDSSSSSSSITELSPPDNKQFKSFDSSNSSSNNHSKRSDSEEHSSFEVADISIQTSRNISLSKLEKIQKNESGCSGSDSSDFVEVHDISLQTSINDHCSSKKYDENSSERNSSDQDSNTSCSFVEVQDISSQDDVKSSGDIPERSLPSQDKSGNLSSRTNSKNKTIFFDAESDFEEININDEKVALKDKQETSRNIISSGSFNFSSDDDSENNCQEKPKKHHTVGNTFSSDEEEELVKITYINNEKVRKSKDCHEQEQVSGHVDNQSELTNETSAHGQEQQGSKIDDILNDSEDDCFKNAVENENKTNWRSKKKFESDSSSDDQLEDFFQKMKGQRLGKKPEPVTKEEESDDSMGSFIVDDFEVTSSEDNSDEEYLPDVLNDSSDESDDDLYTTSLPDPAKKSKKVDSIEILSSDTDEELPTIEKPKPKRQPVKTKREDVFKNPRREDVFKTPKREEVSSKINRGNIPVKKFSFLKSLSSSIPVEICDPDALRYVSSFAKTKEDLTAKLFKFYNETVFDCKLPTNLNIIWNKRLLKTAGYCVNKTNREAIKTCQIELSIKVCDSAERTRDTLIHELCHAAVWVLNGVKDGHGPYWKYWASKANKIHPEIAVVTRCHSYKIQTKYKYQCVDCKYEVGRHSKSLDIKRFVCGKCKGAFVLLDKSGKPANQATNKDGTAKTPNKFALFVKENYKEIKKRDKSMKHGEVMSVLSKEFAKQKLS
ncbi:Acidic repeat-containing protein [Mytilus coruscus]|uniref:Acidic repeat-containing protein n=1 Tax=Mytilus coruscus TaxID=42192 RepID=A0A6J8E3E2_MYTCO|nr:Acidic repeat-containing protein [Mytilus coruscus]